MNIGDVVTWRESKRIKTPKDVGIIVGKHWSYRGKYWWVCFTTGQYSNKERMLCNDKHLIRLEDIS